MAQAAQTSAPPTADPIVVQRALVYAVMGFICFTGLVLTVAFKDPCSGKQTAMAGIGTCRATLQERLPGPIPFIAMVLAFISMVAMYELRWLIRTWLVGAIGLAMLIVAGLIFNAHMPKVLGIANLLVGTALIAAAYGIHRGQRGAWAFAVSAFGTMTLAFFFGSAKMATETHVHLAWAALPALAVFLPACVAIACAAPGGAYYLPFAKRATARR